MSEVSNYHEKRSRIIIILFIIFTNSELLETLDIKYMNV